MSGISKVWHRYWQRDLEDIGNMAKPEDAMTRVRAIEEAARLADEHTWSRVYTKPCPVDFKSGLGDKIRALASAQQEPAPSAELEKRIGELVSGVRRLRNANTELRRAITAGDPERTNNAGTSYAVAKFRLFGLVRMTVPPSESDNRTKVAG